MKNPQEAAAKWSRNLASAGQSIQQGVQAVAVNPAEKAIAALPAAARNYAAAISSGKTAAGLSRTTLGGWQQSMIKKGIPRISEGAAQAQPKMATFLGQLMPHVAAAVAALPPRGTDAENEQRMLQFTRAMKQFKRS